MITATLVYNRRKKATKEKPGMVEIRLTVNRKSIYISTGVRVPLHKWRDGFVVNTVDALELNERLRILLKIANDAANESLMKGRGINAQAIKEKLVMAVDSEGSKAMLEWMDEQIATMNLSKGVVSHYKTLLTRLYEYNKLREWSDLTTENLYKFDGWLHQLQGAQGKKISDGGVWTYHKLMKALIAKAVCYGVIDSNPYDRLKRQFKRGATYRTDYLTEDEMAKIRDMNLRTGSELGKARDLFVFQMYTGLSYADTQAFKIEDYKLVDGRWVNVGERIKTGVAYVSELLPPAVAVLERNGWNVPKLSNQAYNRALKVVGEKAEVTPRLHSHLARHSFATMMLKNGARIENVSKMLGHTNIKQTQRYAKVLAQSVYDDFEMVKKKMKCAKVGRVNVSLFPILMFIRSSLVTLSFVML